ncbi:MAG: dGTP triphosphohydrolase [Chloroherpetonaceae bacterium]
MLNQNLSRREERPFISNNGNEEEFRSPYERDYDRIIYSTAFRRLAGVTQVVNPSEGQIFHNRLTHSLKVAQVGKRIAQKLLHDSESSNQELIQTWGGLQPEVVENAALAHDLGNPPFGHIAETELRRLVEENTIENLQGEEISRLSFEGNAQSFRIVNLLAIAYEEFDGLNLTAATQNAILKYPWCKSKKNEKKFGVYEEENEIFELIRRPYSNLHANKQRTLEAAIMDIADDITYAIHDFEDFFRANIIPFGNFDYEILKQLLADSIRDGFDTWYLNFNVDEISPALDTFFDLINSIPIKSPFTGDSRDRINLHVLTSTLLKHFTYNISINSNFGKNEQPIKMPSISGLVLLYLKRLSKYFVIDNPKLLRQQYGEKEIIKYLFSTFMDSLNDNDSTWKKTWHRLLPYSCSERFSLLQNSIAKNTENKMHQKVRIVADAISCMTDQEAIQTYLRLTGISTGSMFDNILL